MKPLLMLQGWILPKLERLTRAFFAFTLFLWRVLKQFYTLIPILLVIAVLLMVVYLIGHQTGEYSDILSFLGNFKVYIISLFTTAFIIDFVKNEHSRKARLETQYVLYKNFFNILSDFESTVKQVFESRLPPPHPGDMGASGSGEFCTFCFEKAWDATRGDTLFWHDCIDCSDRPAIKSRNDLLGHAVYQLAMRLRDVCILGIQSLEKKAYNNILSYRDAIDEAYYQTRGLDWCSAGYTGNNNPVNNILINSHCILEELYKPWYNPRVEKVLSHMFTDQMED